jgi:hypothetical protein
MAQGDQERSGVKSAEVVDDGKTTARILAHVERHFGADAKITVFHEIISDLIHLDILIVHPAPDRPYTTLVTAGMSSLPMNVPKDSPEIPRFAELILSLPASWPLDQASWQDHRHYWPIRWLKGLARLPHQYETWFSWGQAMPNGEPPEPLSQNTKLSGFVLLLPKLVEDDFLFLDEEVVFLAAYPIHSDELALLKEEDAETLAEKLDAAGVTELVDPKRPSVA